MLDIVVIPSGYCMLFIYVEMPHSIPWTCKITVSTMFVRLPCCMQNSSPMSELHHNPTQSLLLLMSGKSSFTVSLECQLGVLLGTEESPAEETQTPDHESPWLHRGQVTIR